MSVKLPSPTSGGLKRLWTLLGLLLCLFLAFVAGRGYERQRICLVNKLSPAGCKAVLTVLYEPAKVKRIINEDEL